jgi:hypothetical protein
MENQKEKVEEHVRMDVDALKAAVEHVRNKGKNDEKMRKKSFFHIFHEQDDILGRIRQRFPQFMNSAHQITDYLPSLSSTKSRVSSAPVNPRRNLNAYGKAPSNNSNTNSRSYSDGDEGDDQRRYLSQDSNLLKNKGQDPTAVKRGSVLSAKDKQTLFEYDIDKATVEKSIRKKRAEKEREREGSSAQQQEQEHDPIRHFSEKTNPHEIPRSFSLGNEDGKEADGNEEEEDIESRKRRADSEEERKLDSSADDIFTENNIGAMLVLGNNQGIIPDRPGTVSMVNPEFFFESTRGSGGAGGSGGGSHQVGKTRRSGGESGRDEEDGAGGMTGMSSSKKERTAGGRGEDGDSVRGSKRLVTTASRSRSRSEGDVQSNFGDGSLNGELPLNDEELQVISDKNRKFIEEKEGDKEISSNFPLGMPILYFETVQILILLTSLYLALWVTNFVVAADSGWFLFTLLLFVADCFLLLVAGWKVLTLLPGVGGAIVFFSIVKTAALLKSISELDNDAVLEVIEQTEGSRLLGITMREKILSRLNDLGEPQAELYTLFHEIDSSGNGSLR